MFVQQRMHAGAPSGCTPHIQTRTHRSLMTRQGDILVCNKDGSIVYTSASRSDPLSPNLSFPPNSREWVLRIGWLAPPTGRETDRLGEGAEPSGFGSGTRLEASKVSLIRIAPNSVFGWLSAVPFRVQARS